jgi:23S rRNA pseudoU1915 N3-methylase RlmH
MQHNVLPCKPSNCNLKSLNQQENAKNENKFGSKKKVFAYRIRENQAQARLLAPHLDKKNYQAKAQLVALYAGGRCQREASKEFACKKVAEASRIAYYFFNRMN